METKLDTLKQKRKINMYTVRFILIVFSVGCMANQTFSQETNQTLDLDFLKDKKLHEKIEIIEEDNRQRLKISLRDLLYLALTRSLDLQVRKMIEEAALAQLVSAQGRNFPVLSTSLIQNKNISVLDTNLSGENITNDGQPDPYLRTAETDTTTVSASWIKRNDLGMKFSSTLQRTVSHSRLNTMQDKGEALESGGPTDNPLETTSLNAAVSIPIFQDWGEINNLPVRRAELALENSKLTTTTQTFTLLETIAKTYWYLVKVEENTLILEEAVKLSAQLLKETQARVEVGLLQQTDLKEVNTQLASNSHDLLSTKILQQDIEDQLRTYLNMEQYPIGFKPTDVPRIHWDQYAIGFKPTDVPRIDWSRYGYAALLQKAYQNNVEIQLLESSLKSNRFDLVEALNSDKTNLDLEMQYRLNGFGGSTTEALQGFSNTPSHDYQISVSWVVPLFDKVTPQTIMRRKIEKSQLELRVRNQKMQLGVKLQTIFRNMKFSLDEERTAALSLSLAKDLLDQEVEKLKIGNSTSYFLSLAQQRYTGAKFNEMVVRVRFEQNFISMLIITGDIFQYFKLPEQS